MESCFKMSGYKRRKIGNRIPHKIFVIVCEGKETERQYFNRYKIRGCGLKIETPNTNATDPVKLIKFARNQIGRYNLNLKSGDGIYCVFDRDGNTNEIIAHAFDKAGADIKVCLSNPSFELWFLLHFVYSESPLSNPELIGKLEKHILDYRKNKEYYDELLSKRDDAIRNAKKLNEFHHKKDVDLNSIHSNPSTQVFEIVEDILKIAECSV